MPSELERLRMLLREMARLARDAASSPTATSAKCVIEPSS